MTKLQIGINTYSKSAFGARWSDIIKSLVLGTRLCGDDFDFIDASVKLVDKWRKITERGPNYFYRLGSKKFHGKAVQGIILVTPNSAREVWIGKGQITQALFPSEPKPAAVCDKAKVLKALRQIVQPQIDMYRKSVIRQLNSGLRYKQRCAITKQTLNFGDFHIDHKYPFKSLVEDWCSKYGFDLERLDVYCKGTKCYLKNTEIAESFFDYHLLNAQLQPTTSKANLSKGSKIG